jgi:enamine deaminase RidA (YjgF/YER057c/UK114 family)
MEIVQPPEWPRAKGYSNGIIADGRILFIAGQVGWNPITSEFDHADFVGQFRQAMLNIAAVLKAANAGPEHVVRMTWFITDKEAYLGAQREIGAIYREIMGRNYPVMSVIVVKGLIEHGGLLEIEATAVLPR